MLIIRLTRRGRRNDPSFRLVVTEHTNPVKGKFLEELGYLNPKTKAKSLKKERILYWLSQGTKASPTVHNLLVSEGIIQAPKVKAWRPKKREAGEGKPKSETKIEVAPKEAEGENEVTEREAGIKTEEKVAEKVSENNEVAVQPASEAAEEKGEKTEEQLKNKTASEETNP